MENLGCFAVRRSIIRAARKSSGVKTRVDELMALRKRRWTAEDWIGARHRGFAWWIGRRAVVSAVWNGPHLHRAKE